MYRFVLPFKQYFEGFPSQLSVANFFLRNGISVRDDNAYVGEVKQSDSALARAIQVDRRVVRSTIERIMKYPELSNLFSKIGCIADLTDAASLLGCSALEIVPTDDSRPGTMAGIMTILSSAGINVRQAVVSSSRTGFGETHLMITVDGGIPGNIISAVREADGVAQVVIR